MNDMTAIIEPKSDQLNADSLISGPRTITITGVDIRPGTEQPCSIFFQGDEGRPWKPCKSMARVLVAAWGPDAKAYVGRSVTLYRDPSVKWGGMEVGGIRVSHMSHIERDMMMALTATKGKRAPYTVKVLTGAAPSTPAEIPESEARAALEAATDLEALERAWKSKAMAPHRAALREVVEARKTALTTPEPTPDPEIDEEDPFGN